MPPESTRKPADLAGSVVTGGLGGGSLVAFAQNLNDPYSKVLSISAPLLASLWAALFPRFLRWSEKKIETRQWRSERLDVLHQMDEIISQSRATLDATAASDVKEFLEQRIGKLELERARIATATPGSRPWTNVQIRTAPLPAQELVPQSSPAATAPASAEKAASPGAV